MKVRAGAGRSGSETSILVVRGCIARRERVKEGLFVAAVAGKGTSEMFRRDRKAVDCPTETVDDCARHSHY